MFSSLFFFFNATATTEIYTLSLHDALPIWRSGVAAPGRADRPGSAVPWPRGRSRWCPRAAAAADCRDRKSTRLNSSHSSISYAVFCLKKKKKKKQHTHNRNANQSEDPRGTE